MNAWNVTGPSTVGALDARTGRRLWAATLTASTEEPAISGNAIYASTANGAVALNARTGARLWESAEIEGNPGMLFAADGIICGNTSTPQAVLTGATALDAATGQRMWSYRLADGVSSIALDAGRLLAADNSGALYALRA
jgi:outer membrane protein assembly factor BamB